MTDNPKKLWGRSLSEPQKLVGDAARNAASVVAKTLPRRTPKPLPTHCRNCDETLTGEYCARCGQRNDRDAISMGEVWGDFFDEFVKWDGKLLRTLWLLISKLGALTVEYVQGRRIRYFAPFRMYLVLSATFFLLIPRSAVRIPDSPPPEKSDTIASASVVKAKQPPSATPSKLAVTSNDLEPKVEGVSPIHGKVHVGNVVVDTDKLPDTLAKYETFQDTLPPSKRDDWVRQWIIRRIYSMNENPNRFVRENLFAALPNMMFLLMPFYALLLKMLYVRQKRYYIEHFVFTLHTHTFYFVLCLISLLIDVRFSGESTISIWLHSALFLGAVMYTIIALRRVYRQNWKMTLWKAFHLFSINFYILIVAGAFAFFLTALMPS